MSLLIVSFSSDQDVSIINSLTTPPILTWRRWQEEIVSRGFFVRYVAIFPEPPPHSIGEAIDILAESPAWELVSARDAVGRIERLCKEAGTQVATLIEDSAMLVAPDLCLLSSRAMTRVDADVVEGTQFPEGAFPATVRIDSLLQTAKQLGFLPTNTADLKGLIGRRIVCRAPAQMEAPELSVHVRHIPWDSLRQFTQGKSWPSVEAVISRLRGIDRHGATLVPRYLRRRRPAAAPVDQPLVAVASFKGDVTAGAEVSLRNFWNNARRLRKMLIIPWPGTLRDACPGKYLVHPVQVNPFTMGRLFAHAQSLKRLLRQESVDIVYTNNAHAAQIPVAAGILLGIPTVARLIGVTIRRNLDVSLLRWADAVIVPSAFLKSHALKCGVVENRIAVIHEAVDDRFLRASPLALERQGNGKMIGVFAMLTPAKRIEECIRTLSLLRVKDTDYKMSIFGWSGTDGCSALEKLRNLARQLGVENAVNFGGFAEDVLEAYSEVDLVLHLGEEESWGMVVTEAMALGLPVVAFASGALPEQVIDGQTGLLCHSGRAEEAAHLIERVLTDPSLKRRLVWTSIEHVRSNFSAMTVARQIEEILLRAYRGPSERIAWQIDSNLLSYLDRGIRASHRCVQKMRPE